MTQIYLKKFMEKHAHLEAENFCDLMNYKRGTKSYDKAYEEAFTRFCVEAYEHSLTPSGELKGNPTTPKLVRNVFENMPVTSSFIDELKFFGSQEEKEVVKAQLRGAIMSIVNVLLKYKYGMKTKGKGKELSDFEFSPIAGEKKTAEEERRQIQVEVNLYVRTMVAVMTCVKLEELFTGHEVEKEELKKVLKENLPSDDEGNITKNEMHKQENRIVFAQRIYEWFKRKA